jgi:hypothetical protein
LKFAGLVCAEFQQTQVCFTVKKAAVLNFSAPPPFYENYELKVTDKQLVLVHFYKSATFNS